MDSAQGHGGEAFAAVGWGVVKMQMPPIPILSGRDECLAWAKWKTKPVYFINYTGKAIIVPYVRRRHFAIIVRLAWVYPGWFY